MPRVRRPAILSAFLLGPLFLSGCALGSRTIRASFADYNETIHYNESQEMLLNLVRLKYRETPMFLKVGALSSSYAYEASAGARFGKATGAKSYGLDVGSSISARPTITYTPLEGNTFVKQILAEIDRETFILLIRSGWPASMLAQILVERVDNVFNDGDSPTYTEFMGMVESLQAAQDNGRIEFAMQDDTLVMAVLRPDEAGGMQRQVIDFKRVQFRSLLDILYYLGKNTEVPEEHATWVKPGEPNHWMTIRSSGTEPDDALVWVRHHGYYFSIAQADIRSKDTFALVKVLFQMQAGDVKSVQPILTLPLAAP